MQAIARAIVKRLTHTKQTLAVAESCTGGFIANEITNVPGASKIFPGGVVSYSNAAKRKFLGVRAGALAQHGAVSEAVARQMAEGARRKFGADFAIAVTGIAGPGGGSKAKPVGTVFIALAGPFDTIVQRKLNSGSRDHFKKLTTRQAFALLKTKMEAE